MTSWQPSSSTARSRNLNRERALPSGHCNVRDILDESIPIGRFVGVIGLVKDRRSPIPTGGSDWKSALTIYDKSIEDEPDRGLLINVFRPESEMPEPDAGDVVLITSAKVQLYRGEISLISHRTTTIHVYSAARIPSPPKSAKQALLASGRPNDRPPSDGEHEYVAWLYHSINKDALPHTAEFQIQVDRSRNVKDKFSLLSDVHDGRFCDVIVNVVRDPFDQMDKTTLWVSDYTENNHFYKFSWDPTGVPGGRDSDPYGYIKNTAPSNWPGPYGRRSMQVTCFGPHAEFVREEVRAGNWVRLRNLQIKYGHNANNLEGYLREDRNTYGSHIRVDILATDDPDSIDTRLKDAIRRKLAYEKAKKSEKNKFTAGEKGKGTSEKRKAEDQGEVVNSKYRRQLERAQRSKEEAMEREREQLGSGPILGLSEFVKCESLDQPVSAVSSILKPIPWTTTVNGEEVTLTLPFTCAKYRAYVRVLDFRPHKLEDFATWRKNTEYDMLSEHSGASESESDVERGTLHQYTGKKIWEWRFALLLEEADPKCKGEDDRVWVVVDNTEAQQLINLDALDLRENPKELDSLRERLYRLWGNLEEHKRQELQIQIKNKRRLAAQQPPDSTPPRPPSSLQVRRGDNEVSAVSNKPFPCCIRQYGIKIPEKDPQKANAGEGKRWERVFGLFGTRISN